MVWWGFGAYFQRIYTHTPFAPMKSFPIVCQSCQKVFYVYNSYYVNTRPVKFCSLSCNRRLIRLNDDYFKDLTEDKYHTFGQVIACGYILDHKTITIRSDIPTLEKIKLSLSTDYPIKNAEVGKFQLKISSLPMVDFPLELGLTRNKYFQEYPPYDILTGLLDTDCYEKKDGVQLFRTPSSKLALEVARLVGGEIITETYKDIPKGVLGCNWVVVW